MEYILFLLCLALLGLSEYRHSKIEAALRNNIASNAAATAKLQKGLEDLQKEFNELADASLNEMDAEEFEKRWQSGVASIMNYCADEAMKGILNG